MERVCSSSARHFAGQKYYDTPRMSECLAKQNEKADRWLGVVLESYARYCAEAMADMAHGGNVPFDQVVAEADFAAMIRDA